ncbi:hypothetical protein [Sagittula sp. S175]
MRQRVGVTQAILHDTQVLFLDEPTSGPDPWACAIYVESSTACATGA